jgi:hypothetical protein
MKTENVVFKHWTMDKVQKLNNPKFKEVCFQNPSSQIDQISEISGSHGGEYEV